MDKMFWRGKSRESEGVQSEYTATSGMCHGRTGRTLCFVTALLLCATSCSSRRGPLWVYNPDNRIGQITKFTVSGEKVFAAVTLLEGDYLATLDARTGKELWRRRLEDSGLFRALKQDKRDKSETYEIADLARPSSLEPNGGAVYISFGRQAWFRTGQTTADGLGISVLRFQPNRAWAFDYTGKQLWAKEGDEAKQALKGLIPPQFPDVVEQRELRWTVDSTNQIKYSVRSETNFWGKFKPEKLIASDAASGSVLWRSGDEEGAFGPPIVAKGVVYIATMFGSEQGGARLYAFESKR